MPQFSCRYAPPGRRGSCPHAPLGRRGFVPARATRSESRRLVCKYSSVMEALLPVADRSRRGPARAHVYAALRDAIVSAQLAPGRQLSENELAALLGVSRTPIREALQRLREERLPPGGGAAPGALRPRQP